MNRSVPKIVGLVDFEGIGGAANPFFDVECQMELNSVRKDS